MKWIEGENITRSDSFDSLKILDVDDVDAIVRFGRIPGVVGEVDDVVVNNCGGTPVLLHKGPRTVWRR